MTTQPTSPANPGLHLVHDSGDRAPARVVVVGGGIAGMAAAHTLLHDTEQNLQITVLEGTSTLGGKLRVSEIAGVPVDEGAEAMQATRPEAVTFARSIGLEQDIVYPRMSGAGLWTRGRIRPMPPTVMGVPTDLRALTASGVLPLRSVLRLPAEGMRSGTAFEDDVSVGAFIEERLGREVVDTLVEPLLGGVYAGRADALSLRATVPTLFREMHSERSLLRAARRLTAGASRESRARSGPVFAGIQRGVGRMAGAAADHLRGQGVEIMVDTPLRSLHAGEDGWRLVVGSGQSQQVLQCDAVILAVPAEQASALLSQLSPAISSDLGLIKQASVAIVTLAYRVADVPTPLTGTGFLVPPKEGRPTKAVNFATNKWEWVNIMARTSSRDGLVIMRASLGRLGEEALLERDDEDLVALANRDISEALQISGRPVASRVTRWRDAIPQYAVGHVTRIERVRNRLGDFSGLELAGAMFDGVGVAAAVGSGRTAGTSVLRFLEQRAQSRHG